MAVYRDKDGNIYTPVVVGNKEFLVEPLKTTKYKDGSGVPLITDPVAWANVGIKNCNVYGGLYNFFAASKNGGSGSGSVAPTGFHVPTLTEFDSLITFLGGASIAGKHMKEVGLVHWDVVNTGDNSSGFTAIANGYRDWYDGQYYNLNWQCNLWTCTEIVDEFGSYEANSKILSSDSDAIAAFNDNKIAGLGIRCLKDSTILTEGQTSTVTDICGNVYTTICINGQEWMVQNLRTKKYNDGSDIPIITDNAAWSSDTTGAGCFYDNTEVPCNTLDAYCLYDNNSANNTFGKLYNFHAVNHGNVVVGADLCYIEKDGIPDPTWRIATNADYAATGTYLGGDAVAGGKMKQAGTTNWTTPNTDGTNSSGFTALPGGFRDDSGNFANINNENIIWTSDVYDALNAYYARLNYDSAVLTEGVGITLNKKYGGTVILVRDYTPNPVTPPIPQPPYSVGNFPDYRFYISNASSLSFEVFPLNFLSTSIVDELQEGKVFHRRSFNGSLIFGTNSRVKDFEGNTHNRCDDFDLLWLIEQSEPCQKLYLDIIKISGGVTFEYWQGYFSTPLGRWDLDRKTFEVTPVTNDEFTLILDEADTLYNILAYTSEVATVANDGVINVTFNHCHWLMDVINYIASQVAPAITIQSNFFTAATNPVTLQASKTTLLMIAQKSDIIRPTAYHNAVNGLLSWNQLMEILWSMFQVTWTYDPLLEIIHIEHISAFPVTTQGVIDIRTQQSCKATNKYIYVKEEMPKQEIYSFMEAGDINFLGVPIYYQSACLNPDPESNKKEISINVTTDITHIVLHQEAIADPGWVILCNEGAGPYNVIVEVGELSPTTLLNMHLSWANLQVNYFLYNRVLIEGYINNQLTQFGSSLKTKQQECSAIFCNPFNPADVVRTELGEVYFSGERAEIKRAELRPSGEIALTLRYGTANYNLTPPPAPRKWIKIIMTDCTHFDAILSEAAPVGGIDIEFHYLVFDSDRNVICQNAAPWDVWTIAAGENIASYDLTLLCAIPEGGCIYFVYPDVNTVPGWVTNLIYDETCRC